MKIWTKPNNENFETKVHNKLFNVQGYFTKRMIFNLCNGNQNLRKHVSIWLCYTFYSSKCIILRPTWLNITVETSCIWFYSSGKFRSCYTLKMKLMKCIIVGRGNKFDMIDLCAKRSIVALFPKGLKANKFVLSAILSSFSNLAYTWKSSDEVDT